MNVRKNPRALVVPAAQMDWLQDLPAQNLSAVHALQWLHTWAEGRALLELAVLHICQVWWLRLHTFQLLVYR